MILVSLKDLSNYTNIEAVSSAHVFVMKSYPSQLLVQGRLSQTTELFPQPMLPGLCAGSGQAAFIYREDHTSSCFIVLSRGLMSQCIQTSWSTAYVRVNCFYSCISLIPMK